MRKPIRNVVVLPSEHESAPVPHLDELEQTEIPFVPSLSVKVDGLVTTQELPATASVMRSLSLTSSATDGVQQFQGRDPRRKSLTIWVETNGIYLSNTREGVVGTTPWGAHLPAGGSITINHKNSVWIVGDNASPTLMSYMLEQWAD